MEGTGFLGQAAKDVYHLEQDDLYLVGTAEVPLAAYHADEILDPATLPRHYVGYSPSYRREAGAAGKDTRGIFRVHWFDKVEMFVFCAPEDRPSEHASCSSGRRSSSPRWRSRSRCRSWPRAIIGLSAARKYDCCGWLPTQERYREITSTSNCTEFQARRLNIRGRFADGTGPVATLNGTLCAMTRMIIMILENHQQADGSVRIPAALRPFLGGREALTRVDQLRLPTAGWRPRLVALDVDGTIVDRDGVLPAAVGEAIAAVVAAGIPVVLSTGRSWHGTRDLVDLLRSARRAGGVLQRRGDRQLSARGDRQGDHLRSAGRDRQGGGVRARDLDRGRGDRPRLPAQ